MTQLNPYVVSWLILVPQKGTATKADAAKASIIVRGHKMYFMKTKNCIYTHQPNRQFAIDNIKKIKGKLSKKYTAYIVTDKQMGLATRDNPDIIIFNDDKTGIKLTSKQKQDRILI